VRHPSRLLVPVALALLALLTACGSPGPSANVGLPPASPEGRNQACTSGQQTSPPLSSTTFLTGYVYLPLVTRAEPSEFTFAATADMRSYAGPDTYDSSRYFRGACEAIAARSDTAFMVSPGDINPPAGVEWTLQETLGPKYLWFPVAGNHEAEMPEDMAWLRSYDADSNGLAPPNVVNTGPAPCEETTYSFDYGDAHFVLLNEYCNATSDTGADGDVADPVYQWLADDLDATEQTWVFVLGHEPAYVQPDDESGRLRHLGESLDAVPAHRDRFWNLLRDQGVTAYICGHTHNYSAVQIDGVWQLDLGHARGVADQDARSTFVLVHVTPGGVTFEAYRSDGDSPYARADSGVLSGSIGEADSLARARKTGPLHRSIVEERK